MKSHVLSVGQCSSDDARIARVLAVEADAHLDRVASVNGALGLLAERTYDLVLVNRILDPDGSSGVEAIGLLKREQPSLTFMLVSDYPEAHAQAVAAGAVKGFGKSDLGTAEVGQLLRQVLHSTARAGHLQTQPRPVAS